MTIESIPPLKHLHVEQLEYTGVYIFFLFLLQNIDCGYSLERVSTINNFSKIIKTIFFATKFSIFTAEKNLCIFGFVNARSYSYLAEKYLAVLLCVVICVYCLLLSCLSLVVSGLEFLLKWNNLQTAIFFLLRLKL